MYRMKLSDSEILEQIQSGKKLLYSQIVEKYKEQAMTLALRVLKNREDAEEAIQDAFIRAYNALDKFERRSKFSTWLYRIVYNVCLSHLSKKNRNIDFVREDDNVDTSEEIYPIISTGNEYEKNELIALIQTTIEELPEKYGIMLSLFYFQELSYEEICDVTRLPLGTVKTHLFRARSLLLKRLAEQYAITA